MIPIKLRLVLMFISVVTGVYIPASMMGLTFHNAFYAKQQLNCVNDTSSALMKMFDVSDPADLVRKNDMISHDLKTCIHNLNYNKGLITFTREELSR